jgi:hypothetical protein
MRLIWKKYDSEFDPIVASVGAGFFGCGVYGLALFGHALRNPRVWVLAAIPLVMAVVGVITLVREYQLWKMR